MVDLLAALEAAKLNASFHSGTTGTSGSTVKSDPDFSGLEELKPGATTKTEVAPVAPTSGSGATGATVDKAVAPGYDDTKHERVQRVNLSGATGASGSTLKQSVCDFQADMNHCHFCGKRETADALFVAVLTYTPGARHWIHHHCHDEHTRRCTEQRGARHG